MVKLRRVRPTTPELPEDEPDDEFFHEVEQQYEDAYATYLDARREMAHLKASRGFYPRGGIG